MAAGGWGVKGEGTGFLLGGWGVKVLVTQSCLTLCCPVESMTSSVPWDSPGKNTGVGSHSLLQGIFDPGIEPRLQTDSLLSAPPGLKLRWWTHGDFHCDGSATPMISNTHPTGKWALGLSDERPPDVTSGECILGQGVLRLGTSASRLLASLKARGHPASGSLAE